MSNTDFFEQFEDAIFDGDIEAIKKIVADGGDINEISDNQQNPMTLLALCEESSPELVEGMIELGCDPNKTVEYRRSFSGADALCVAINRGYELSAKLLVETEEDVNLPSGGMGDTPLIAAMKAATKKPEFALAMLELLMEKGADPKIKNKNDLSAIDVANGHSEHERWSPDIGERVASILNA